jgi:hypothetical protein
LLTNTIGIIENSWVSLAIDTPPVVEFRSARFRGRRDLVLIAVLVALVAVLLLVDIPTGERIIPLTAIAAIAIGWARSLRESWSIGEGWISHRRWFGTRHATVDQLRGIEVLAVEKSSPELVLLSATSPLTVPLHDLADHPEFATRLGHFVEAAAARSVPGAPNAALLLV